MRVLSTKGGAPSITSPPGEEAGLESPTSCGLLAQLSLKIGLGGRAPTPNLSCEQLPWGIMMVPPSKDTLHYQVRLFRAQVELAVKREGRCVRQKSSVDQVLEAQESRCRWPGSGERVRWEGHGRGCRGRKQDDPPTHRRVGGGRGKAS